MRQSFMRHLGAALACVALCATTSARQSETSQPPPKEKPQTFRTEANYVRVDVYPLRGGVPVHDLGAEDFEILEDGVRQRIEAFEHVVIHPAGPQSERREPSSQRESLQAAANPRNRVFVVFLDVPNVGVDGAYQINEPLIRLLNRVLGPDDLVGIMTPGMAASQMVLGRKTQVIEEGLRENWAWGRRFSLMLDERERAYEACYPPLTSELKAGKRQSDLAKELIRRRRERATLEALQDLVRYLHAVREERKAILAITEGWLLIRPNPSLMNLRKDPDAKWEEPIPGRDPIVVDPNGKLTTKDRRSYPEDSLNKRECDTDRMRLAALDNDQFLRDIIDEANRANASFYPIDPRGLAAVDNPMGPDRPPPVDVDQNMLKARHEAMRTLAGATDGIAVLNSNDLDKGLRRVADDLTSYYLLGYYSSNTKLDGRFRRITVRVTQPGIEVRARHGYRAATAEEVSAARRAAEPSAAAKSNAFEAAIASLARIRPEAPFRINAATAADGNGNGRSLWVAGELQTGRSGDFDLGATADIEATAGAASSTSRVALKPGERTFLTTMKLPTAAARQITVKARLVGEGGGAPLTDVVTIESAPEILQPLLFRRGTSTGNRVVPAADFRFSRTERLRLELPAAANVKPGAGRVLDKTGQPLQVPVTVAERVEDATGQRWITADVTLAPLAPGDFAIEIGILDAAREQRVVTAIRVTR